MSETATSTIDVCPADELQPGDSRLLDVDGRRIGVFNAGGELYAIEDRCSHDDGPLAEGDWDPEERVVVCPRHGSRFDLRTGKALTLPAFMPVAVYPVRVVDGWIKLDLG